MPYIAPESVIQAKKIDLLSYLQSREPQELVRISEGVYHTKTHDSLKISNGKWMWWSRNIGGVSALDYLVKVRGMTFVQAVDTLLDTSVSEPVPAPNREENKQRRLILPEKNSDHSRVMTYLLGRGIDREIISDCMDKGILYESKPYHNAVFVGKDETGYPKYASYRATGSKRIMGECPGSDKRYAFRLEKQNTSSVHLFECAIDLLSYATLLKQSGKDYRQYTLLSLAGVYKAKAKTEDSAVPVALEQYLKTHPDTARIVTHFDNDEVGRSAANALKTILTGRIITDKPPPSGKDFNEFLCSGGLASLKKERSYVR